MVKLKTMFYLFYYPLFRARRFLISVHGKSFDKKTKNPESGFYLNNLNELTKKLIELETKGKKQYY